MTHAELVALAARWLRSKGYGTVVTDTLFVAGEKPDAIGFTANGFSLVVEAKATRADFLRDRQKFHRKHPDQAMGDRRVLLCPPGVVTPEDLGGVYEKWGLIHSAGSRCRVLVRGTQLAKNLRAEQLLLLAYVRRLEGVSKRLKPRPPPAPATGPG